jgi:hypothetical protein
MITQKLVTKHSVSVNGEMVNLFSIRRREIDEDNYIISNETTSPASRSKFVEQLASAQVVLDDIQDSLDQIDAMLTE